MGRAANAPDKLIVNLTGRNLINNDSEAFWTANTKQPSFVRTAVPEVDFKGGSAMGAAVLART